MNRSFMLTLQISMSSRKCEAMGWGNDCSTKHCYGVALGEPTRLFCGALPVADVFTVDVVWPNPRIFWNFDKLRMENALLASGDHGLFESCRLHWITCGNLLSRAAFLSPQR